MLAVGRWRPRPAGVCVGRGGGVEEVSILTNPIGDCCIACFLFIFDNRLFLDSGGRYDIDIIINTVLACLLVRSMGIRAMLTFDFRAVL